MEAKPVELKALLVSITAIILVEGASRLMISKVLFHPMIILGGTRVLETGAIIYSVLIWGKGLLSIGLARGMLIRGLRRGVIWSIGFATVATFISLALYMASINPLKLIQIRLPGEFEEIFLIFLIGGIVGPISEEVFFRGMVYGFLRRWGVVPALVVSIGLFVLGHPIAAGMPIPQVVGGIVFALAYEIEGSLMAPIVIHVLGNLALFTLSLIT